MTVRRIHREQFQPGGKEEIKGRVAGETDAGTLESGPQGIAGRADEPSAMREKGCSSSPAAAGEGFTVHHACRDSEVLGVADDLVNAKASEDPEPTNHAEQLFRSCPYRR